MRRFPWALALLVLALQACDTAPVAPNAPADVPSVTLPDVAVSDGRLVFDDREHFAAFTSAAQQLDADRLAAWEAAAGFRSLESEQAEAARTGAAPALGFRVPDPALATALSPAGEFVMGGRLHRLTDGELLVIEGDGVVERVEVTIDVEPMSAPAGLPSNIDPIECTIYDLDCGGGGGGGGGTPSCSPGSDLSGPMQKRRLDFGPRECDPDDTRDLFRWRLQGEIWRIYMNNIYESYGARTDFYKLSRTWSRGYYYADERADELYVGCTAVSGGSGSISNGPNGEQDKSTVKVYFDTSILFATGPDVQGTFECYHEVTDASIAAYATGSTESVSTRRTL